MLTGLHRTLALVALIALLSGCAIYPAVQIAGAAMTGYDAVHLADDHLPRDGVGAGGRGVGGDIMLERRLRERLALNGLTSVSANVIDGQAYLVGRLPGRAEADRTVKVASQVQGLTTINCKFFPIPDNQRAAKDTAILSDLGKRIGGRDDLSNAVLRLDVISGNAVIVGKAWTFDQKNAILKLASSTGGVLNVVDYMVVENQPTTAAN